jgi:prophage maintenance system killer protein
MTKEKLPLPRHWLTLAECVKLYRRLGGLFGKLDIEPLPSVSSRFPHRLEAILGSAKIVADLQNFDIADLASYYLVFITRGHPLIEGNKRAAVAFCLAYLWREGYLLNANPRGLYEATVLIAQSEVEEAELCAMISDAFRDIITKK